MGRTNGRERTAGVGGGDRGRKGERKDREGATLQHFMVIEETGRCLNTSSELRVRTIHWKLYIIYSDVQPPMCPIHALLV